MLAQLTDEALGVSVLSPCPDMPEHFIISRLQLLLPVKCDAALAPGCLLTNSKAIPLNNKDSSTTAAAGQPASLPLYSG